jgi:hypothetical protein
MVLLEHGQDVAALERPSRLSKRRHLGSGQPELRKGAADSVGVFAVYHVLLLSTPAT